MLHHPACLGPFSAPANQMTADSRPAMDYRWRMRILGSMPGGWSTQLVGGRGRAHQSIANIHAGVGPRSTDIGVASHI